MYTVEWGSSDPAGTNWPLKCVDCPPGNLAAAPWCSWGTGCIVVLFFLYFSCIYTWGTECIDVLFPFCIFLQLQFRNRMHWCTSFFVLYLSCIYSCGAKCIVVVPFLYFSCIYSWGTECNDVLFLHLQMGNIMHYWSFLFVLFLQQRRWRQSRLVVHFVFKMLNYLFLSTMYCCTL